MEMMERLLEQKLAINAALHADKHTNVTSLELSCTEWQLLDDLIPVLHPFKLATEAMSGEKYITASLVLPCVYQLLHETNQNGASSSGVIRNVCHAITNDLEKRFPTDRNLDSPIAFAALMDPRFKNLSFITPATKKTLLNNFEVTICQLQTTNKDEINQEKIEMQIPMIEPSSKRARNHPLNELLSKLCPSVSSGVDTGSQMRTTMDQLALYLTETVLDIPDPLLWWRENASRFPALCEFARKYLCIPATSVPSERIFSESGNIVTAKRSCLQPDTVELLTFLHNNE